MQTLNKIVPLYRVRDMPVMLDNDIAKLYGVATKRINEAVRNNLDKFEVDFYFELTKIEFEVLRSNISTANFSKRRSTPKVFTKQGIYMLATVLKSPIATKVSVSLIRMFATLRRRHLNIVK
jgi:hypothetical protein